MQTVLTKPKRSLALKNVHPLNVVKCSTGDNGTRKPTILLVHNRPIVRHGLALIIQSFKDFVLIGHAGSAEAAIDKLQTSPADIIIIDNDVTIPEVYRIARWIKANEKGVKVLMLGSVEQEPACLRLISEGVSGLISRHASVGELYQALKSIYEQGFYSGESGFGVYVKLCESKASRYFLKRKMLSDYEIEFLEQAASEKTYKEIASHLRITIRAVDSLRDKLFGKFGVRSRVGLVMLAIKEGIVSI